MSQFVRSRYRGTVTYFRVYTELITAARYRGTVTYQELAKIMCLPLQGSYMGKEVGHILGEIAEDEFRNNRPLLSAIAVGVSGAPGPGLFTLAGQLGKFSGASKEEKEEFWKKECQAVYETWKVDLRS